MYHTLSSRCVKYVLKLFQTKNEEIVYLQLFLEKGFLIQ